jgi:hypothetical protein
MTAGPRHHLIAADVPCIRCGRPGLQFARTLVSADIYRCPSCGSNAMHSRIGRGGSRCGIREILAHGYYGRLVLCELTDAAKGE